MDGNKWDAHYMRLAKQVASWSKDKRAGVGAVIVKGNRVIATGFNGFPTGVSDDLDRLDEKAIKYELVVHAEVNALIVAGQRAEGADLYVWGKPICTACAGAIIQSGIKRVIAEVPEYEGGYEAAIAAVKIKAKDEKAGAQIDWDMKGIIARHMFGECGIEVDHYPHNRVKDDLDLKSDEDKKGQPRAANNNKVAAARASQKAGLRKTRPARVSRRKPARRA